MIDLILSLIGGKGAAILAGIVVVIGFLTGRTVRDRRAGAKKERERAAQDALDRAAATKKGINDALQSDDDIRRGGARWFDRLRKYDGL